MKRAIAVAMIAVAGAVLLLAASSGHWRIAIAAAGLVALEGFWLVRAHTPLRIRRKPLRIGSGGGRGQ